MFGVFDSIGAAQRARQPGTLLPPRIPPALADGSAALSAGRCRFVVWARSHRNPAAALSFGRAPIAIASGLFEMRGWAAGVYSDGCGRGAAILALPLLPPRIPPALAGGSAALWAGRCRFAVWARSHRDCVGLPEPPRAPTANGSLQRQRK